MVTVTWNGAGDPLETVTVDGTLQVAPVGAPEHESETDPLKPLPVSERLYAAVDPGATLAEEEPLEAPRVKVGEAAVPARLTSCVPKLSVTVKDAAKLPVPAASKVTVSVHEAFTASDVPQLLVRWND